MRANEFLKEVDGLKLVSTEPSQAQAINISIPTNMFQQSQQPVVGAESLKAQEEVEVVASEPTEPAGDNEISDLVRLAGVDSQDRSAGQNHTIAAPATGDVPEHPVFVSPLQQQLELQKQQGGKESPVINQIIDNTILGSTAGEQPEQSVYHDSPSEDNEWVGAGTGEVEEPRNSTTTSGANKSWYKL